MTVHIDLIETAEDGWICKSPGFPAWIYRADDLDGLKEKAEASLRMHMMRVTKILWLGWDGRT